jgi:16S rRNA (uracil1498-N3)-methyltransferase
MFYSTDIANGFARFDEEESRHLMTVLRHKIGDRLRLTDGKGHFYDTELTELGKKQAVARILSTTEAPPERPARLHIAIAPTKQMERFEWFLEKAVELGVDTVTPLLCKRSERNTVRQDRLEKVVVSAMKQSLRAWLPQLNPLTPFQQLIPKAMEAQKRIAWCSDAPVPHLKSTLNTQLDVLILIGPEGDFSPEEVALALKHGFEAVSLGAARLRTETAGIAAVAGYNW